MRTINSFTSQTWNVSDAFLPIIFKIPFLTAAAVLHPFYSIPSIFHQISPLKKRLFNARAVALFLELFGSPLCSLLSLLISFVFSTLSTPVLLSFRKMSSFRPLKSQHLLLTLKIKKFPLNIKKKFSLNWKYLFKYFHFGNWK